MQSQKAVSAYFTSKQILPFGFAEQSWCATFVRLLQIGVMSHGLYKSMTIEQSQSTVTQSFYRSKILSQHWDKDSASRQDVWYIQTPASWWMWSFKAPRPVLPAVNRNYGRRKWRNLRLLARDADPVPKGDYGLHELTLTKQTRYIDPMLLWCRAIVVDGGPTKIGSIFCVGREGSGILY